MVSLPGAQESAIVFEGQRAALLVRPRANAVSVDAASGAVLLVTDARDLGAHQRISEMADPLHFGTFGGYWTRVPWFLFGLLLTGLALSGVAIYGLRIARETRQVLATRAGLRIAWAGMRYWRLPALLLILASLALIPGLFVAPN